MPEAKVDVKATEAPVEGEYLPEGDAPFTESAEKATAEAEKESAGEVSTEAEEIADAIKPGEAESAEPEPVDEVEEILAEPKTEEGKSHVQKRIDDLTREKKLLEERLTKLEQEKTTKEGKEPEYTDAQLRTAMKKALEDGDGNLAMDIFDYRIKKMEDTLVKRYEEDKQVTFKQAKAIQDEWNSVVTTYDRYIDPKTPEIYAGSHKDLSLRDASSLLYQVALALYQSDDPTKAAYYHQVGGQKLAVADAMAYILSKKAGKGKDSEKELLKRQLQKEKRKKSIVGGGPGEESKAPGRPQTDAERLEEVIEERKKFQEERML